MLEKTQGYNVDLNGGLCLGQKSMIIFGHVFISKGEFDQRHVDKSLVLRTGFLHWPVVFL